jgi:hypothetical protein
MNPELPKHILLISGDAVNRNMGVGVRNWELANASPGIAGDLAHSGETDLRSKRTAGAL